MPLRRPQIQNPEMVAANRFDPNAGASSQINPAARLAQISAEWAQNPGRAPNGSGSTGLLSNDSRGWSDMLNQQTEAVRLQDYLGGGEGTANTRYGGEYDPIRGHMDRATGRRNERAFGLPSGVSGGAIEGIVAAEQKRNKFQAAQNQYTATAPKVTR